MPSFSEMNTKVNVSIGLILFLVLSTFAVTSFYLEQVTLEERMDKRYKRLQEQLKKQDEEIRQLYKEFNIK